MTKSFVGNQRYLTQLAKIKGVMARSMLDALSKLCFPFLKGGNSEFIAAIASGLFLQTEYRSLE